MANKKFSPMRYTASTEEAAIAGALQIVGVSREEAEVEIIEQSAKGVTVRIRPRPEVVTPVATEMEPSTESQDLTPTESTLETLRDSGDAPIAEDVPELLAEADEEQDEVSASSESDIDVLGGGEEELDALAADFAEETPDFVAATEAVNEAENLVSDPVAGALATDVEAENRPEVESESAPEIALLSPEIVAHAQQKAQEILDKMGLDAQAQIEVAKEANTAALVIEGDDVGILIGKHGATLQAFQYLLNLTLNAHLDGETARQSGVRVAVDAGNYRARRQSSLEQVARSAASKVRRDGRLVRLDPMPAHERRLVHMFLQTESDVVTQSEGREPMRRIVVAPIPVQAATPEVVEPTRSERVPSSGSGNSGNRSGFGAFRRGDAQSERNRGLQRGR